jgi:hypothetical protein
VSNVENWKPCENGGVFSFIKTFVNNFKFITKNRVNLQRNHQGTRVWKNAIIPSSTRFNFEMKTHLSWFEIFIMRMLRQCQIQGWFLRQFFIHLCGLKPIKHGHKQCHKFKEKQKKWLKLIWWWMCEKFYTSKCVVVIYKPRKNKEKHKVTI